MADQDVKIRLETEADTKELKDYAKEYQKLRTELDAVQAKLADLTEQSAENPLMGEEIPVLTEQVEKLEGALKKTGDRMAKSAATTTKSDQALDGAAKSGDEFTAALEKARKEMGFGESAAAQLRDRLKELEEGEKSAGEEAEKLGKNVERIADVQKLQAVESLSDSLAQSGAKLVQSGVEIAKFDRDLGETLSTFGEATEAAGSLGSAFAKGAQAGGPLVGVLAAVADGVGQVFGAWVEMNKSIAESEKRVETAIQSKMDTLEAYGALLADRKLDKFQERLRDELDLLGRQERAIQLNIDLQRKRAEAEAEIQRIRDNAAKVQIQRDLRDGNITQGKAVEQTAQIDIRTIEERRNQPVQRAQNSVQDTQARRAAVDAQVAAVQAELDEVHNTLSIMQDRIDSGDGFSKSEISDLSKSTFESVRKLAADDALERGELQASFDNFSGEAERLEGVLVEKDEKLNRLAEEIDTKNKELAQVKDLSEGFIRAESDVAIASVKDELKLAADGAFQPVVDALKEGRESFIEAGGVMTEENKAHFEALEGLIKERKSASDQYAEFQKRVIALNEAGIGKSDENLNLLNNLAGKWSAQDRRIQQIEAFLRR